MSKSSSFKPSKTCFCEREGQWSKLAPNKVAHLIRRVSNISECYIPSAMDNVQTNRLGKLIIRRSVTDCQASLASAKWGVHIYEIYAEYTGTHVSILHIPNGFTYFLSYFVSYSTYYFTYLFIYSAYVSNIENTHILVLCKLFVIIVVIFCKLYYILCCIFCIFLCIFCIFLSYTSYFVAYFEYQIAL